MMDKGEALKVKPGKSASLSSSSTEEEISTIKEDPSNELKKQL